MAQKTRLLVLGGTHLGRGPEPEPSAALEGIVQRIVRWRPDAIAVEVLPGELVDSYRRLGGPYDGMRVGGFPDAVACAEAVHGLHEWDLWQSREVGDDRTRQPVERVVAWCAAYEPYTALLHARGLELPTQLRSALDEVERKGGETWRVTGTAASRLGLQRLHPFDDHSDGSAVTGATDAERDQIMATVIRRAQSHPLLAGHDAEVSEALAAGDLWPLWRRRNAPDVTRASEEMESGLFLDVEEHPVAARRSLAAWRARNLLMAGRLRSITGEYAGGRVLAVVGHAHKGPLEVALGAEQWDLELADVAELDSPV